MKVLGTWWTEGGSGRVRRVEDEDLETMEFFVAKEPGLLEAMEDRTGLPATIRAACPSHCPLAVLLPDLPLPPPFTEPDLAFLRAPP